MKERRLGKVIVSGTFIDNEIDAVSEIFAKIKAVVLQVDHRYDSDLFEYTLYSPLFEVIKKGMYAPKYKLEISKEQDSEGNMISFDVKARKLPWDYEHPYSPTIMEMMLENASKRKEA